MGKWSGSHWCKWWLLLGFLIVHGNGDYGGYYQG